MTHIKTHATLSLAFFLCLSACGPSETNPEPDASTQADASDTSDAGVDASDTDTAADGGGPETDDGGSEDDGGDDTQCQGWPTPRLGSAAASVALAAAPARCGQDAHAWLDPAPLGEPKEFGASQRLTKGLVKAALASQGVDLGDRVAYDTFIEQFSYTTQDRGEAIEATALVARPLGTDTVKGTLLVLHGTTGFMDDCAPSAAAEGRALVGLFASFGYLVVAPDFIGLKALGDPSPRDRQKSRMPSSA